MTEGIQDSITDINSTSTLPEFAAATTLPSREKLFEEQQKVISEWIDDINKADIALGGSLEPSKSASINPAPLVERMHPKYKGGWEDMLKGRDFVSAATIVDVSKPVLLIDTLSGKTREEKYKNIFFGTLKDGTKVLELVRIDYKNPDNGHRDCNVYTEVVTDKNKAEVEEVVTNRLNETIAKRKELIAEKQLSSLPKVELPQI